jgi:hypothetical protein
METPLASRSRKRNAAFRFRKEADRGRRQPRPPSRDLRHWLFTMLFLGLIGLLVGVMLGGMIMA